MIKILQYVSVLAIAMALQACANTDLRMQSAVADKSFHSWFLGLVEQIKADSHYNRIALDTAEQQGEFMQLLHDAYRHNITKEQFAQFVNNQYPGHRYEIDFIIRRMPD